jgi:hypothetical protein
MTRYLALRDARQLLASGKPTEALAVMRPFLNGDPEAKNVQGVALLRLGRVDEALRVFESLVLSKDGVSPRKNVPDLVKTNLATALLLSGDVRECLRILRDLKNAGQYPAVRLQTAIERWWKSVSLWHRLRWCLGGTPRRPVKLDFPPGDVAGPLGVISPPRAA